MRRELRRRAPLCHAYERAAIHEDMPVAPGLAGDPLHRIMTVTADLQADVVALLAAGTAASPDFHLHEDVATLHESPEILIAAAVDVVLRQLQNRRRLARQVRWLED